MGSAFANYTLNTRIKSVEVVMLKRNVALFLLLQFALLPTVVNSAVQSTDAKTVSWSQLSRNEWLLVIAVPRVQIDTVLLANSYWSHVSCRGLSSYNLPGAPDLPAVSLWVPANVSSAGFELIREVGRTVTVAPPLPVPQPLDRSVHSSHTYVPIHEYYERSSYYPDEIVEIVQTGKVAGTDLTLARICPIKYSGASRSLYVSDTLVFRVTIPGNQSLDSEPSQSSFESRLVSDIVEFQRRANPPTQVDEPRLLVITHPEFVEGLQEWLGFKYECGITAEVVIYPDIASSPQSLKSYLQQRFDASETPPEFVLLIGDYELIPAFFGVGSSLTDHPYSCLTNDDFLPDLSIGRLPVDSPSQLERWISRALAYERDAQLGETAEATVFSSSVALDPLHGQQVREVFQSAGLNPTSLQQPQTGALPLLLASLNAQPLWTFYIGHGNPNSWSSVSPHFTSSTLPQLQTSRQGIVISVACATADFDEGQNCIAEDWTLELQDAGALCYIGATESTAFFYSDTIGLATLEAIFEHDYTSIGMALDYGKLRCAQFFPQSPGGLTEETIQQFALLGDPSLRPFTASPVTVEASIPDVLPIGTAHIPVTIRYDGRGVPDAEVILTRPDANPQISYTDGDGFALVPLPDSGERQWTVTVRGLNLVPIQRNVSVVPVAGAILQLQSIDFEESVWDLDGMLDPADSGTFRVLVRNAGTVASEAGRLRIECSSDALSLNPGYLDLPVIEAHSEDWLEMTGNYSVSTTAANGTVAVLQVWAEQGERNSYIGNQRSVIEAPEIEVIWQRLDELSGDGDMLPEAGETIGLSIQLKNIGDEVLRQPVVDCMPDHQFLHIQETRWSTDSVAESDSVTVQFSFSSDSATPRGYAFEYNAVLTGTNFPDQNIWGHFRIGRVPVLLYVLDSQPQQLAGIQGALQVLGIEYETSAQIPPDLSRYGSIWIFCGVHPNQEPLPSQAADRIADYLHDGGACYWEGGDVWAFDHENSLHPYFGIEGVSDGSGDAGPCSGIRGRFTENMQFNYGGENSFIDRIRPIGSAFEILRNSRNGAEYSIAIANSGDGFRTVGCSVELGALHDGDAPSTRVHLVRQILEWFGIPVLHDLNPPYITHVPVGIWQNYNLPIPVFADVQDESDLELVACDYRVGGGALHTVPMQEELDGYVCYIPVQTPGSTISYRLRAVDRSEPQNTALTDEFTVIVENSAERMVSVIPESESIQWMKRRGANGTVSIVGTETGRKSIVLIANGSAKTSSYISVPLNLSEIENPCLEFESSIEGTNARDMVIARIVASVDCGNSFPILIWRRSEGPIASEVISEDNLKEIAGLEQVVLKFIYYGDSYWHLVDIRITDMTVTGRPVRDLVVKPGAVISLHWTPSGLPDARYQVFAASSLSESFEPIAEVSDTFYLDQASQLIPQRFYRVSELSGAFDTPASRLVNTMFNRIPRAFERR